MSTTRIPLPDPGSTHSPEYLAHVANAIAKIVKQHPQLCGCGENLAAVGDRQCTRCWIEGIQARNHRRREREAMEEQKANAQDDYQALTQAEQMDNDRWVQADEVNDRKHEGDTP